MTTMKNASTSLATRRLPARQAALALAAATARLAIVLSAAAGLFILLMNAVADALVYAIAGVLALFWSSCLVGNSVGRHASQHADHRTHAHAQVVDSRAVARRHH